MAYYPKDWVIGLSKINRIVLVFLLNVRLVQERLTEQLLTPLQTILETDDVAVYVKAYPFLCEGVVLEIQIVILSHLLMVAYF